MRISDWSSDVCSSDLIRFAVPNHPWHDTETTAAVRIAMTVIVKGASVGEIQQVVNERKRRGETSFDLQRVIGRIQVDLSIGAEVASASPLKSNRNLSRSEEHTSELQSLMRISYAVFCLKKKKKEK